MVAVTRILSRSLEPVYTCLFSHATGRLLIPEHIRFFFSILGTEFSVSQFNFWKAFAGLCVRTPPLIPDVTICFRWSAPSHWRLHFSFGDSSL
jgi:hypothetical protein